jgi:hypothetical protein
MEKLILNEPSKINLLSSYLHDRFFDIDKIRYDREKKEIHIPTTVIYPTAFSRKNFFFIYKEYHKVFEADLSIFNVLSYKIIDKAEIGQGDFNKFEFQNNLFIIKCGVPVEIQISVSGFEVECIINDNVTEYKKYYTFHFCKR